MYARLAVLATLLASTYAFAQPAEPIYLRMYSVNYNAWIESDGVRLHQYGGWNSPSSNNAAFIADYRDNSHGLLRIRQVELDVDEYPLFGDGFRYDDATYTAAVDQWYSGGGQGGFYDGSMVDYKMLSINYDFARRVDFGEIDEVNHNCSPFLGYWETNMNGYGGYWCNSSPTQYVPCSRIFVIGGLNYERGIAEMLHSHCHRTESIMRRTYGNTWNMRYPQDLWDYFTLNVGTTGTYQESYGVGNCHYPYNADDDYDYANTQIVLSNAPLWETMDPNDPHDFPDLTGTPSLLGRDEWGGPDYHRTYMNYFYAHMPHFDGTNSKFGYTRLNNWWEYVFNFNEHADSGGDFERSGIPPETAGSTRSDVYNVSISAGDDWRPQVSTSHWLVWAGARADGDMDIYAAHAGGTGLTNVSFLDGIDEMPQIAANGTVVWQHFDGFDFEIYTANVDGTGLTRITNNDTMDWHVDITDTGRIVWEGFDGEDYEIYSCNADGSDLVQITNNTHGGIGIPRDDMWPRINNSNRIVWMGYDGGNYEIYSANADGSDLLAISGSTYDAEFPQISDGGHVVWHAWENTSNADVYIANATGGGVTRVTNDGYLDWYPQVNSSGEMVWMKRYGNDWEVFRRSAGGTITNLTNNNTHDQYPVIDDDGRIAWHGFDTYDWEIFLYDGTTQQITFNNYDDRAVSIATGGDIAWHGESHAGDPNDPNYVGPTTEIFSTQTDDTDCNSNGIDDFDDIVGGAADDCNNNAAPDSCDVVDGTSADCNGNTIPDECDIVSGFSIDCNENGIPDDCDITSGFATDCNGNGVPDTCDLTSGFAIDCNENGLPDSCDVTSGASADCNANNVPDECDIAPTGFDLVDDVAAVNGWLEIAASGTPLNLGDDGHTNINVGFVTDVFQTEVYRIANNGAIGFVTGGGMSSINAPIPDPYAFAGSQVLFPFWDDLDSDTGDVYWQVLGTAPNRIAIVQWDDRPHRVGDSILDGDECTFQVQIFESHVNGAYAQMLYQDTDFLKTSYNDGASASIGYQEDGASGLQWSYNEAGAVVGGNPYGTVLTLMATPPNSTDSDGNGIPDECDGITLCPGDANCDGFINFRDIDYFVAAQNDNVAAWEALFGGSPTCDFLNNDTNGDGFVNFRDIDPFVALQNTTCP